MYKKQTGSLLIKCVYRCILVDCIHVFSWNESFPFLPIIVLFIDRSFVILKDLITTHYVLKDLINIRQNFQELKSTGKVLWTFKASL